jgi:hypothetical protein
LDNSLPSERGFDEAMLDDGGKAQVLAKPSFLRKDKWLSKKSLYPSFFTDKA